MNRHPLCGGKPNCKNTVGPKDPRMLAFAVDGDQYVCFLICPACKDHLCPEDTLSLLPNPGLHLLELRPIQTIMRRGALGPDQLAVIPIHPGWLLEGVLNLVERGHDLPQAVTWLVMMNGGSETRH